MSELVSNYESSNCVEQHIQKGELKTRIKPLYALTELFANGLPTGTIKERLDLLENYVKNVAKAKGFEVPNQGAFSNTRGTWFEAFVAVFAWNFRIENQLNDILIVKMPNVKTFDFRRIFNPKTSEMISQLDRSLLTHTGGENVRLITSNPDLLIVKQESLVQKAFNERIQTLNLPQLEEASGLYRYLEGNVSWDSLVAGVGIKTSLRPDRRLQVVHEGNILKALFAHLKMRNWNRHPRFRYYGASSEKISQADDDALQTAATHSIINVDTPPERAVDDIFSLTTFDDINKMFTKILK
ncbi:Cfr10I/Bse634I family restriction endonuclease [Bacillus sp. 165]|uniref:Cfr10I/Bse634I family restriction endonuclease n=1 Tax=Bacillus sp. 165 TaxID=1529117 RepID=UPI001ADCFF42|nr:Cfr10I/Bse634I family restriction endonuclease [Bacillus sp. 165]MBO9131434.1 Cfr10I/Bse634I family restriction endonuclease [Bacillus sp. 165]